MLKDYIFWGGLIAVLIGVVASLVQRRQRRRRWQNPPPAEAPIPPSRDRRAADRPLSGTTRLMCLDGSHRGHRFDLPPGGLSIGRAQDNQLIIVDGRISAHHAWIGMVDGRVMLRDYQSLNGTFLNDDTDSRVTETALIHGDMISFGGQGRHRYQLVVE